MRTRLLWLPLLGLALSLLTLPLAPALAGEAEKKEPAPAKEEKKAEPPAETKAAPEKPAGLVGTVVAVVPASRTLVVDIPLGKEVLRVGAEVTAKTKITGAGGVMSLERLKAGDRVRIDFRRMQTGDEAIAVELLRSSKG